MPGLVRLYIRQVLIGFALSGVFVALLLYANVGNLWHLVTATQGGVVAVIMLFMFNGIVFAGVQFAIAIMRMAKTDDKPGGGKRDALPVLQPEPVPVRVQSRPGR